MAKTVTFGLIHLVTSFSVTYALTGSITIAGVVTFVEPLVNTVMHYFFDTYWDHPRARRARRILALAVSRLGQLPVASAPVPVPVHFSTKARSIT